MLEGSSQEQQVWAVSRIRGREKGRRGSGQGGLGASVKARGLRFSCRSLGSGERFGGLSATEQSRNCSNHYRYWASAEHETFYFFNENISFGNRQKDACKDNAFTIYVLIHFNIFKAKTVFIQLSWKQFTKWRNLGHKQQGPNWIGSPSLAESLLPDIHKGKPPANINSINVGERWWLCRLFYSGYNQ